MKAGPRISVLLFSCALFLPSRCEGSVIEALCSSVTDFLNDEAAKTDADLKACKDKCGWKKRKDDLVDAASKKAKESCSKGEAPDINELSKGLDRNTKDRLKGLYDRNSRMFDGKAKLEAANFGAVSSKNTAITGKGGGVTDLKSAEPDTPKLNTASEFSLAKPSNTLAPTKTAVSATAEVAAGIDPGFGGCYCQVQPEIIFIESSPSVPNLAACEKKCCSDYGLLCTGGGGGGTGTGLLDKLKAAWKKLKDSAKNIKDWMSDKYHELKGDKKCGTAWYSPKKQCCLNTVILGKCGSECYNPEMETCTNDEITCPVASLAPYTDPENTVDVAGMQQDAQAAVTCFRNAVTTAGGSVNVTSAFRSQAYQDHLQEVWDKHIELKNNTSQACSTIKQAVDAEFDSHDLLESQRPANVSLHTAGNAFDANVISLPENVDVDDMAALCGVERPRPIADPVHYEYTGQ